MIISADSKYDMMINNLCIKNKIEFMNKKTFNKSKKKVFLCAKNSDFLLSIYSSIIIPNNIFNSVKNHSLNLHPGILPYYPGKNCVSGAIYNSEKKIGATIHKMVTKVDSGDILSIDSLSLSNLDTAISAMEKLKILSLKMIKHLILDIVNNKKLIFKKNNLTKKKFFPKYIPNRGYINKHLSNEKLLRLYKASYFGPFNSPWGSLKLKYKKEVYFIKNILLYKDSNHIYLLKKINKNLIELHLNKNMYKIIV
jgi:methionyl-tRNA formyltransferase